MKQNLSSGRDALKACLDASKARSPEGVACVPAESFLVSLGGEQFVGNIQTSGDFKGMDRITIKEESARRFSREDGEKMVARMVKAFPAAKLVPTPSPDESVPLDGPEAVRIPASGLDSSSADVPPAKRPDCGCPLTAGYHMAGEPCCTVAVEGVKTPSYLMVEGTRKDIPVTSETRLCLEYSDGSHSDFDVSTLLAHAAHLAKIQALTEALENLLEDTGIKDAIWLVESKPGDEVDDEDARTMACVSAARAALSLPSA